MKYFHISDVLSVTTERLVSTRHMRGVYDILNFLTGDNLYTHQLPRAMRESEPWLRTQFPQLMDDDPAMQEHLKRLDEIADRYQKDQNVADLEAAIHVWIETVRESFGLPEMLPVYEMGADMHVHIDPEEELKAMVGDDKVISIKLDEEE